MSLWWEHVLSEERPTGGRGRRQPLSGGSVERMGRAGSGLGRLPSGEAPGHSRSGSGAQDGLGKSGERLMRRQQLNQREALLRDLERQLGLEQPPGRDARPEAARGPGSRDPTRSDERREIAQRARRLLEDLGGLEPGEDFNRCDPNLKLPCLPARSVGQNSRSGI